MKRGRPRAFNPNIPAHIDQAKLPNGAYFDHRWAGSWYVLEVIDGRRCRKNIAGAKATLADLHRLIECRLSDVPRGTLDWLCSQFEASDKFKALAKGTREDYSYCRLTLARVKTRENRPFSGLFVAGLTRPLVQRLIDKIATDRPSTANHVLRYLRRLFRWGQNRGYCAGNPAEGIESATERKQRRVPELAVLIALVQYAARCGSLPARSKGAQPPYLWAVAELAYLCRLRGIEVVTLTDANLVGDGVMTNRRKGSRDNIVALTPRLRAAWDFLVSRRERILAAKKVPIPMRAEDRPLVVAEDGAALKRSALGTAWQRLILAAMADGVISADQRFGLHDLKRRGITDTKGTRHDKQQSSGHKNEAMLDVYDFSVPVVQPAGE